MQHVRCAQPLSQEHSHMLLQHAKHVLPAMRTAHYTCRLAWQPREDPLRTDMQ